MTVEDRNIRTRWDRERMTSSVSAGPRTKQSFRSECDINAIVKRWQSTGVLEHLNQREARYGNFENVHDYLEALSRVREAQSDFDALPATLRQTCGNDPAEFVAFINNAENADELREIGLSRLADSLHGAPPETPASIPPEPPQAPPEAPEKPPKEA